MTATNCPYCHKPVDPESPDSWAAAVLWVRDTTEEVVSVERLDEEAHAECVRRQNYESVPFYGESTVASEETKRRLKELR